MNKKIEYENLINDIDTKFNKYNNIYKKAHKRLIKRRLITYTATSLGTILSVFLLFAILINTSVSFAYACGDIPIINKLAKSIAYQPSLKAAIDNKYVQPIDISNSKDNVKVNIEYLIVDQKQVNVFFYVTSDKYKNIDIRPTVLDDNNKQLDCSYGIDGVDDNSEMRMITMDFGEKNVPNTINLSLDIINKTTEASITNFNFKLGIDPSFTSNGETIEVNKEFVIDGQTLKITNVEIYPTHMRVNFEDNKNNTKWLKSLNFYTKDENGKIISKIAHGTTSTGCEESPMMVSHRLESNYFERSKELTIYIDEISWLNKTNNSIKVDIKNNKQLTNSPMYKLYQTKKTATGWKVAFIITKSDPNSMIHLFQSYTDEENVKHFIDNSTCVRKLPNTEDNIELTENQYVEYVYIDNYDNDIIYFNPYITDITELDTPVSIKIK